MPKGVYQRKPASRVAIGDYVPKCVVVGCNNLAEKLHKRSYYQKWQQTHRGRPNAVKELEGWNCGKYCSYHRSLKRGREDRLSLHNRLRAEAGNKPCQICGWDKASCDMHRIVAGKDGGVYKIGNIISLCPNCHRLVHKGLLKI